MSEQVLQRGNAVERSRTRTIAQVAMLGAVGRSTDESGVSDSVSCTVFLSA